MKTILYFLAFVLIWTFSCSYQKQSPDSVATNKQKAFPYQLNSIPSAWVLYENDWFEFHIPLTGKLLGDLRWILMSQKFSLLIAWPS